MGVMQVAGIALLCAVCVYLIKEMKPALASPVRLGTTLLLFSLSLALYVPILGRVEVLLSLSSTAYVTPLLRAAGVALICEMTAACCRDLGENGVATGVLTFGKLEILVLCLPLVDHVLEIAKELLDF